MSEIKTIDMSTVGEDELTRTNKVLETIFGITVTALKSQSITLFGELTLYLVADRIYAPAPYLENKSGGKRVLDLCSDSSTVYYVVGDDYVAIWGSRTDDYQYTNCIVKISDDVYHFPRANGDCFGSLKNGTFYSVSGTWPSNGGDSLLEGVVLPMYCLSSIAGKSFVSDRCYWVTRAGELLPIGSEVTVGDETYIILTQGSQGITIRNSSEIGFQLAVKKK